MQATKTHGKNRPNTATQNPAPTPLDTIIAGIARDLGYTPETIPSTFNTQEAAKILSLSPHTLCAWRSSGLYSLHYLKIGRRVRYPLTSLAEFLLSRLYAHTHQTVAEQA